MSEVLLETKNLKKYFSTPRGLLYAVDGVNFSLKKGKTLGVVGESGCGKSTLGRVVLRLLEATSGEIFYNGEDILKYSNEEMNRMRLKMQIIFQDPYASLNPRLTVSDIIAEPLKVCRTVVGKEAISNKVSELMDIVGLADRFVNSYPHELDGGRRQRIGIARALALGPEFIVCDEPVSALDVSIQAQVLNLLMDLQEERGLTYMFITHNLSVVKHISDDIMVMYLGQCVEFCSADELFENTLHPYTQGLLVGIPIANLEVARHSKFFVLKGEVASPINPKSGCRFATRCIYAKAECTNADVPLREISSGHFVACTRYK